ncbi:hypothetical protein R3P38DRAFT_2669502 [Favolaschia claudopus]|uniref:F-box domain-containing protein n=1 Tax=Favolaschia claudopus TaxID=2862362 RepID=A0AAV9Z7I3_9AGAR
MKHSENSSASAGLDGMGKYLPIPEPTAHFLSSNDAPSGCTISTIQNILVLKRVRVHALREEIEDLRRLTAQRLEELEDTENSVDGYTKTLSTIRRLPAEILCEIFAWVLRRTCLLGDKSSQHPPWKLGHICRRWRAVAVDYPSLWSTITVYFPTSTLKAQPASSQAIATQLSRTRETPLDVTLDCDNAGCIADPDVGKSITMICSHSHRWRSLEVHANAKLADILFRRMADIQGKLPMLRTLNLSVGTSLAGVMGDIFLSAPSLNEVALHEGEHSFPIQLPQIPWRQITQFRGGRYITTRAGLEILKASPVLAEVGFTMNRYPGYAKQTPGQEQLSHLHVPTLRRMALIEKPGDFFEHVTLPSLQELWVSDSYLLPSFIQRSSCLLVKLVIENVSTPSSIVTALEASPALTTFYITFDDRVRKERLLVYNALKRTGTPSDICPGLTHVAAGGRSTSNLITFFEMVESRWRPSASPRLRFVRAIHRLQEQHVRSLIGQIEKLKRQGLDVDFDTEIYQRPGGHYMVVGRP